jgi:hypothetical protein
MSTEHQWQTRVELWNGQVAFAKRRHLAVVSASGPYRSRGLLENGGSWTKNVCRTPIANRGRSIEWSSYFRYASPFSCGFRFRSVSTTTKIANYSRKKATGRQMSTEHQQQIRVGLSNGQVTITTRRHVAAVFASECVLTTFKSANNFGNLDEKFCRPPTANQI